MSDEWAMRALLFVSGAFVGTIIMFTSAAILLSRYHALVERLIDDFQKAVGFSNDER